MELNHYFKFYIDSKIKTMFNQGRQRMDTSSDGSFLPRQFRRQPMRRFRGRRTNPGKQALREIRKMKKAINKSVELKHKTTAVDALALNTNAAAATSLVLMQQGNTSNTREGDDITLKQMTWKLQFQLNTAEANPVTLRMIVVYDRRPLGAGVGLADILNAERTWGLMNLDGDMKGRFQIVHDNIFEFATGGQEAHFTKGYVDLKNKKTIYDGNVGDITDVQEGNLSVFLITNGNASSVIANGFVRLRWVG